MLDDIQPEGGEARWIDAHMYLMKYGFRWEDLDRIDDACPSCLRLFNAAQRHPSADDEKTQKSVRS